MPGRRLRASLFINVKETHVENHSLLPPWSLWDEMSCFYCGIAARALLSVPVWAQLWWSLSTTLQVWARVSAAQAPAAQDLALGGVRVAVPPSGCAASHCPPSQQRRQCPGINTHLTLGQVGGACWFMRRIFHISNRKTGFRLWTSLSPPHIAFYRCAKLWKTAPLSSQFGSKQNKDLKGKLATVLIHTLSLSFFLFIWSMDTSEFSFLHILPVSYHFWLESQTQLCYLSSLGKRSIKEHYTLGTYFRNYSRSLFQGTWLTFSPKQVRRKMLQALLGKSSLQAQCLSQKFKIVPSDYYLSHTIIYLFILVCT